MTKTKIVRQFWIPAVGFVLQSIQKRQNASVFPTLPSEPVWPILKWIQGFRRYEATRYSNVSLNDGDTF
jgi:hypothetical protein